MDWKEKAIKTLRNSLLPVPTELNELDWKSGLSSKTERLAQHKSAFANFEGGGIFVFGVDADGSLLSISKQETDERNEILANTMLLLRFCEKRGSRIDYAIEAIEKQGLPPVKFERSENHTRVIALKN